MVLASGAAQTIQGRLLLAEMEQRKQAQRAELLDRLTNRLVQGGLQGLGTVDSMVQAKAQRDESRRRWDAEQARLASNDAFARQKHADAQAEVGRRAEMQARQQSQAERDAALERAAPGASSRAQAYLQQLAQQGPSNPLAFYKPPGSVEQAVTTNPQDAASLRALGMEAGGQITPAERAGILAKDRMQQEAAGAALDKTKAQSDKLRAQMTALDGEARKVAVPGSADYKELEARRNAVEETLGIVDKYSALNDQDLKTLAQFRSLSDLKESAPLSDWSTSISRALEFDAGLLTAKGEAQASAEVAEARGEWDRAQEATAALNAELKSAHERGDLSTAAYEAVIEAVNYKAKQVGMYLKGQGPVTDADVGRTALLDIFDNPAAVVRQLRNNASTRMDSYSTWIERIKMQGQQVPETFDKTLRDYGTDPRSGQVQYKGGPSAERVAQMTAAGTLSPEERAKADAAAEGRVSARFSGDPSKVKGTSFAGLTRGAAAGLEEGMDIVEERAGKAASAAKEALKPDPDSFLGKVYNFFEPPDEVDKKGTAALNKGYEESLEERAKAQASNKRASKLEGGRRAQVAQQTGDAQRRAREAITGLKTLLPGLPDDESAANYARHEADRLRRAGNTERADRIGKFIVELEKMERLYRESKQRRSGQPVPGVIGE